MRAAAGTNGGAAQWQEFTGAEELLTTAQLDPSGR